MPQTFVQLDIDDIADLDHGSAQCLQAGCDPLDISLMDVVIAIIDYP